MGGVDGCGGMGCESSGADTGSGGGGVAERWEVGGGVRDGSCVDGSGRGGVGLS